MINAFRLLTNTTTGFFGSFYGSFALFLPYPDEAFQNRSFWLESDFSLKISRSATAFGYLPNTTSWFKAKITKQKLIINQSLSFKESHHNVQRVNPVSNIIFTGGEGVMKNSFKLLGRLKNSRKILPFGLLFVWVYFLHFFC